MNAGKVGQPYLYIAFCLVHDMSVISLERRVKFGLLIGTLWTSFFLTSCVPGPGLQRLFTQREYAPSPTQQSAPSSYVTTTPVPEPPSHSPTTSSSDANAVATGAEILSFLSPTLGGKLLFGGAGAYARTEAIIEGQKESAGIIRESITRQGSSALGQSVPDGLSYSYSREFGKVELIVANQSVDINSNGVADRFELRPARKFLKNDAIYIAFQLFDGRGVSNPEFKIFDSTSNVIAQDKAREDNVVYGSSAFKLNSADSGKYFLALFGEIPKPGPWTQRPFGQLGVAYFIHAIQFEVVDD